MKTNKRKIGDKCPFCGGSGLVLEHADAHRSEGWIPCRWHSDGLQCNRGKLIKDWRGGGNDQKTL